MEFTKSSAGEKLQESVYPVNIVKTSCATIFQHPAKHAHYTLFRSEAALAELLCVGFI